MTERADAAARAARLIGGRLYMYVTGDPGADDIAEYLAQGWIQAHDNYGEGESDTRVALDLTSSLQHLASALDRLAHDISTDGIGQVAELRSIR